MKAYKLILLSLISLFYGASSYAQQQELDVSLFMKKDGVYTNSIESETGDLYKKVGHHGPAIENLWVAYRLYFNELGSIDLLSKFQPRLELRTSKWYPDKAMKKNGYGTDNYLVRETIGLGGIRLWDNNSVQNLGPVSKRTAEVILEESMAQIRMTSLSIPHQGDLIDLEVVITTWLGTRHAVVEVNVLNEIPVQFATGMTIHPDLRISNTENYLLSWGDYDSPATAAKFNVGAALIYDKNDFEDNLVTDQELFLISIPTTYLRYLISTSNDKEDSELNNYDAFEAYIQQLAIAK
ncbi:MAG: DUF4861 domain-containing protein [Bacteroidetes bacterium]|nr:DUF4861 domain-containing protein [Bacteroidota bacterium]